MRNCTIHCRSSPTTSKANRFLIFHMLWSCKNILMNITWRVSAALCNCRDLIKSDADCEFFLWHVMHFFELFWIANWIFSHLSRDTRTSVFVKWLAAYSPENVLHMKETESTAFRISIFSYISFSRAPRKTAWKRAPETINKSIGTEKNFGCAQKSKLCKFRVALVSPRSREKKILGSRLDVSFTPLRH